jgi:hypothetical protein
MFISSNSYCVAGDKVIIYQKMDSVSAAVVEVVRDWGNDCHVTQRLRGAP